MITSDFVKTVNKLRLENNNKWYFLRGTVNGKDFELKGYGTWLQVLKINNWNCSNPMEQKISDFKKHLQKVADTAPNYKYVKKDI